jgi:ribA/ribD-fused uncharacterized protein
MTIRQFVGEYFFLSNFYEALPLIKIDGKYWPTTEHYFQAMKSLDEKEQEKVRACSTPGFAKRAGRHVTLRDDWQQVKEEVMLKALRVKFQNPELEKKLLDTNNDILEEGNTWNDMYWGKDLKSGMGHNRLGILLMQVRDERRKAISQSQKSGD